MVLKKVSEIFGIEKVSDSVSIIFSIKKSIRFGIGKKLVLKKVSELVSKIFGIGKKIRFRFCSDFGYSHTLVSPTPTSKGNYEYF